MADVRSGVSLAELQGMNPNAFEHFVAELWTFYGWNTSVTQRSQDQGIDVEAWRPSDGRRQYIQAKRYASGNTVGSDELQQYAALRQQGDVDGVVVVTTSRFTGPAQDLAEDLDVQLVDGRGLVEMLDDIDGGHDRARRYLRGTADLTGEYRARLPAEAAARPEPTGWWVGALLAGLGFVAVIPVFALLQSVPGIDAVGVGGLLFLGSGGLALVSLYKLEGILAGTPSLPGPIRWLAGWHGFTVGYPVAAIAGLTVGGATDGLVETLVLLGLWLFLAAVPIGAAAVYYRIKPMLEAGTIAARLDSVRAARQALTEGPAQAAGGAMYLQQRSADAPDEVVAALPDLVALIEPDSIAAEHAASAVDNVSSGFPEQTVAHLGALETAFDATDDPETARAVASSIGNAATADPETTEDTARRVLDALSTQDPDRRGAAAVGARSLAAPHPDIVGDYVSALVDVVTTPHEDPGPGQYAAGALLELSRRRPVTVADAVPTLIQFVAANPTVPSAPTLYSTIAECAYLADLSAAGERTNGPAPDPAMRAELDAMRGGASPVVDRIRAGETGSYDELFALQGIDRAVDAGLRTEARPVREQAWALACVRARSDPAVLPQDEAVRTMKRGQPAQQRVAAMAVARAATVDPATGETYVPTLVALLERGDSPDVHSGTDEGVLDPALRALATVSEARPTALRTHADAVARYLDHDDEAIAAGAAQVLHNLAAAFPGAVAPYEATLASLAKQDTPRSHIAASALSVVRE
jgi:hypothetical protein